ncbi:MAG: hypothetical protein K2P53_04560 [Rickettsiales bacterium]|jgi:hypothetical protein|nr:hypothetical protein [Rickettsiales bacterium]
MKKTILSVTLIILLIATNFIIRYIHIKNIEDNIELISSKLSEDGLKFKYKNITYEGVFFWNLKGKIWNPTFNQEKFGLSEKSSLDHIGFTSLLADKKLSISLANKIDTIIKDSKDEYNYTSTFDTVPELNIQFKDYFMLYNNEKSTSDKLTDFFLKYIQSAQYNSTGHKAKQINKDNSEDLIYSIDKTDINLLNLISANSSSIEFRLSVSKNKYFKNDKEDDFYNYLSEVGDNDLNINSTISFDFKDGSEIDLNKDVILKNIQPVYKLDVQEFYFSSDLFNFYLKGDAIVNKIHLLPYFDIDLKIENLTELVDFYLKFYNKIIVNSPTTKILALREIKNEERDAMLKTFEKIATPSDKKEYKLKVVNLSDKKIKVNDYLMDNVLDIYNSFLVDNNDKKMVNLDPKIN